MKDLPADIRKALAADPATKAKWNDLTPVAQRDFVSWIGSAKRPETRMRRIETARDMLTKGKRRPCCYAVVPMKFYTALGKDPKAKAQWKTLTAMEKRDITGWLDAAKGPEEYGRRIAAACRKLASGKRRP